jgi:hypothetical protein
MSRARRPPSLAAVTPPARLEGAATIARTAHSSSGLGHRPLTAAARVRIPYAPFGASWLSGFGLATRVRRVRRVRKYAPCVPRWYPGISSDLTTWPLEPRPQRPLASRPRRFYADAGPASDGEALEASEGSTPPPAPELGQRASGHPFRSGSGSCRYGSARRRVGRLPTERITCPGFGSSSSSSLCWPFLGSLAGDASLGSRDLSGSAPLTPR